MLQDLFTRAPLGSAYRTPLGSRLKRTRDEFEPRGVEAFAYHDSISIGMMEVTSDIVEVLPFVQRELANIGIAINPRKTVPLPLKGHAPTFEEICFLEGTSVHIAERGGVKVVGVPIGTDVNTRWKPPEMMERNNSRGCCRTCQTNSQPT